MHMPGFSSQPHALNSHRTSFTLGYGGFTLIELVVTVLIVSILAAGAMPVMQLTLKRNKEAELRASLRQIRVALDAYKQAFDDGKIKRTIDTSSLDLANGGLSNSQSGYPPDLLTLEKGVVDQSLPSKKVIRFMRKLPRDPLNKDPLLSAAQTWGTRSYQSEAASPSAGADVYDIYSLSSDTGVNGRPYREW